MTALATVLATDLVTNLAIDLTIYLATDLATDLVTDLVTILALIQNVHLQHGREFGLYSTIIGNNITPLVSNVIIRSFEIDIRIKNDSTDLS